MSAPQGFNPAVSLIPPNPSAPIVPFQGGGGSIQPFYQAIIAGLPEEKRKDLPKQIQILNFTISVEDGKFILKLRVKGKQGTEEEEEEENEDENEDENENEDEEEDENEIIKKAKEFLILEAARNWLRNISTITLNNLGEEKPRTKVKKTLNKALLLIKTARAFGDGVHAAQQKRNALSFFQQASQRAKPQVNSTLRRLKPRRLVQYNPTKPPSSASASSVATPADLAQSGQLAQQITAANL